MIKLKMIVASLLVLGLSVGCKEQTPGQAGSRHADAGSANQGGGTNSDEKIVSGVTLRSSQVLNDKLALLLPQDFSIMSDEMIQVKYPSERRPTLVYTNEATTVNIAINHTNSRMPQSKIQLFHQQMDGMFRKLYPSATWHKSGIIEIGGRNWFILDLLTPAIDTEIRNIMVGTSVEERMLIVSFNVVRELEDDWTPVAEAIIQSLRVS